MARTRSILILLTILTLSLLASAAAGSDVISQITIEPATKLQYQQMLTLGLDVVRSDNGQFVVMATPPDLEQLDRLSIPYSVEHSDVVEFYISRYGKAALTMGGFRTLSEIEAYLDTLTDQYSSITTDKFSIGQTFEGREMWVVKISDNPDVDEDEPEVFYNALTHAREPIGAEALLYFMTYLLSNYGTDSLATALVDTRELYFLTVTNPDGYFFNEESSPGGGGMWRKNMAYYGGSDVGVDLNRNFGYMWGYDDEGSSPDPASYTYRGSAPFSEPETQNVRDYVISREFVLVNNVHSYSNLVLWPYGYATVPCGKDDFFELLGDSLTKYNGYTAQPGWALYPTNGAADDWMWGDTISKPRIISITTEIGASYDGFWPSPSRIPELVEENLWPNLYLAMIADNPYRIGPPNTPTAWVPDSSDATFTVSWQVIDSANVIESYRLVELSGKQTVTDDAETDTTDYWDRNLFNRQAARKHSGYWAWASVNTDAAVHSMTSALSYRVQPNDSLRFWTWYGIEEGFDYFYVQVSADNGNTFVNLAGDLTTNDNPNGANQGNGITGTSGDWVRAAFDLSAYENQQVFFRVAYVTDYHTLGTGVYIDDIENVDIYDLTVEIASGIPDTFYTLTSHPEGEFSYRVSATDAEGQESALSGLTYTKVVHNWILGDANADSKINLADISRLIGYVYLEGIVPEPWESGDVNCDGRINLADISKVIDHVYLTHAPLECP